MGFPSFTPCANENKNCGTVFEPTLSGPSSMLLLHLISVNGPLSRPDSDSPALHYMANREAYGIITPGEGSNA